MLETPFESFKKKNDLFFGHLFPWQAENKNQNLSDETQFPYYLGEFSSRKFLQPFSGIKW